MAKGSDIPPEVRRFVTEHLQSIAQLELLMRLHDAGQQSFTAADLSRDLRTSERAVFGQLTDLFGAGIISVEDADVPRWRFNPSGAEAGTVDELAGCVRQRKRAVHNLILATPNSDVQVFSEAFRLRKDKP